MVGARGAPMIDHDHYRLRELPALPSSWGCAREGRVGSGGRVAPQTPNRGVDEIGYTTVAILRGGALQI